MKKIIFGLMALTLLFSLLFIQTPQPVSATGIGDGSWVLPGAAFGTTYTTVDVEKAAETAPSWVRLFSEGIKISVPTKICYSFRRAAYHWVPKIMQLKKGSWVNITSKIEYLNGDEGGAFACAKPNEAGTFALFAYYNGPREIENAQIKEPGKSFTVGSWDMTVIETQFGDIYANDVNWQGYPTAGRLFFGIYTCWDDLCTDMNTSDMPVLGPTFSYPQHQSITIVEGMAGFFVGQGELESCTMKPFVKLQDGASKDLAIVYLESEYSTRCLP